MMTVTLTRSVAEQKHLLHNNLVSVRVIKCLTDIGKSTMLQSQFIDVISDIPAVSDFINGRSEKWFFFQTVRDLYLNLFLTNI